MKNKKLEKAIIIFCGLACIGAGLFVFFVIDKTYPDSTSSRVQRLNWLLNTFGKLPTALLFAGIGSLIIYFGLRKARK
ncbi:MAG: hypothetical protein WBC06_14045 [Chitinophagaceae bacterium]